ncbi:hypothetical protein AGMMS50255_1940 [Spirochaetia bacterium]|nr:hypothetical protein AGMMS50255_1940 [Spirochaetia bacterium]
MTQTESLTTAEQKEEPATFEKVWAMFRESDRKFQEMTKVIPWSKAATP